jgi:hypothetical protein
VTAPPLAETALLIVCPAAEDAVEGLRLRFDRAAQFGVPAHVTITYPFKPCADLHEGDRAVLRTLMAGFAPFTLEGRRTGWFDDSVVFVALENPSAVVELTNAVTRRFPDFPPYRGAFDEVVPHLTVAHDQPHDVLLAAENDVISRLPFTMAVDRVELWAGPALVGPIRPEWWRIDSFSLG